MKYLMSKLLLIFCSVAFSQSISKQVIGTAGLTLTNSNLKLSYNIGETVVGLMTAGGSQLSNGYYPAMDLQVLSLGDNTMDLQIKLYPNPTSHTLYVSHPEINIFDITIFDLNGKQLYVGIISKEKPLDISNYNQGIYLVTVENQEIHKKNTYKIIKK